jgi:hypothetical protein
MRVRTKIAGLAIAATALTTASVVVSLALEQAALHRSVGDLRKDDESMHQGVGAELERGLLNQTALIAQVVWRTVDSSRLRTSSRLEHDLSLAVGRFKLDREATGGLTDPGAAVAAAPGQVQTRPASSPDPRHVQHGASNRGRPETGSVRMPRAAARN